MWHCKWNLDQQSGHFCIPFSIIFSVGESVISCTASGDWISWPTELTRKRGSIRKWTVNMASWAVKSMIQHISSVYFAFLTIYNYIIIIYFHANIYSYIVPDETICNTKCSFNSSFHCNFVNSRNIADVIILVQVL